jgi:phosphatidylserine decarboxylase
VGRRYDPRDETGFQFTQARGLVVLATPIGLVAMLPVGMAQVSSVILTAREGVTLRKGEEIGYFQFGGSDVVVVFEAASNVCLTAEVGVHYRMGRRIGHADPVLAPCPLIASP